MDEAVSQGGADAQAQLGLVGAVAHAPVQLLDGFQYLVGEKEKVSPGVREIERMVEALKEGT